MAARQPHNVFECLWQRLRSSAGAAMVESLTAVLLTATLCAAGVVPTFTSNSATSGEGALALAVMAIDDELMPGVTSEVSQSSASSEASAAAEDESESASSSQDVPSIPASGDEGVSVNQNVQAQTVANVEEEQSQPMLERTIVTADGIHFTVKLKYDEAAGIPEGAQLSVIQIQPEPEDPKWREDSAYKDRPLETERFVNKIDMAARNAKLSERLKIEKDEYLFYTKYLDISIQVDGATIQPKTPVEITIETDAVDRNVSDAIEIAVDVKSTSAQFNETGFQPVDVKNDTEQARDPENETPEEHDGRVKLTFTTDCVSGLGLAGIAKPLTARPYGNAELKVLGPRSMAAWTDDLWVDADEEQVVLDSFYVGNDPHRNFGTIFWLQAPAATDAAVYRVDDSYIQEQLFGAAGTSTPVAISDKDGVAVLQEESSVSEGDETSDSQMFNVINSSLLTMSTTTANAVDALQVAAVGGSTNDLRASAWDDLQVQATENVRVVTKVYAESREEATVLEGSERYISLDSILFSNYNVTSFSTSGSFGYTYAQSFPDMYRYINGVDGCYFDCAAYEADNRYIERISHTALFGWRYYPPNTYLSFGYAFSGSVGVTYYVCDPNYTAKHIKLTDGNGNLLYLASGKPALFDDLNDAFKALGSCYTTSAHNRKYTGTAYKVMMLKSTYTQNTPITYATGNYQVTLTTEGLSPADGKYRGPGGACTITKGSRVGTNSLIPENFTRFELNNITLDGANIQGGSGALIRMTADNKTLVIGDNTTLKRGVSSSSGGAVYVSNGSTVAVGAAQFLNNTSSVDGGAIATGTNTALTVTGATFNSCTATNLGGAVCISNGATNPTFTNCTISNCSVDESGGGIFTWSGALVLDNCTMTGNQASRAGGCICAGNMGESVTLKNCTMTGNSSATGSVVWLCDTGTLTVDGGTISNNYSELGAIYPNSSSSTLYFMNNAYVYDNHPQQWSSAQCNVYLNGDSNAIVRTNATGLGANAKVGIWVINDYFDAHGGVNDPFGTYASTANLGSFVNDRNNLKASSNTERGWIIWVQPVKVEVRYVSSLDFTSVPTAYSVLYYDEAYNFTQNGSIDIDEIAAELRQQCSGGTSSMQFWRGYSYDPTGTYTLHSSYNDNLQLLSQYEVSTDPSTPPGTWQLVSRYGRAPAHNVWSDEDNMVVVYFTDPVYFTIRNSTDYQMRYDGTGYFGKNGSNNYWGSTNESIKVVTSQGLVNFEASMLNLQPHTELTMQVLGGMGDSYYFSGGFTNNDSQPIRVSENDVVKMVLEPGGSQPNVYTYWVDGNLTTTAGASTVITFNGGDMTTHKVIIRKVDGNTYQSLSDATFTLMSSSQVTIAENLTSGSSGVFYIGELYNGTYYLVESVSPSGYAPDGYYSGVRVYYVVTVNDEGVTVSEPYTGDVSNWGGGYNPGGGGGSSGGDSGGGSGGSTNPVNQLGTPTVGQGCTADQSAITAANWGANSFTWRQGNGYIYGEGNDGYIAAVFANNMYYLPYSYIESSGASSLDRVPGSFFFATQGFNISHLTDGAVHSYVTDNNQWWITTWLWVAYSG